MKRSILIISIISLVVIIAVLFNSISSFIINVQWFKEVSYLPIYFTKLIAIVKLFIPSFIIILHAYGFIIIH
ncbi:Uncharacterised protein family (UPF0182) [Clostridium tetanomorphum]|nr:Uncharacterised protein family (UPF0182) [Clostridium tetanomorphum]